MKTVMLILSVFLLCACEEEVSSKQFSDMSRGVCQESVNVNTCFLDGSKCVNECGKKVHLVSCQRSVDGILSISGNPINDENLCDVIASNIGGSQWTLERTFIPFSNSDCMVNNLNGHTQCRRVQ